MAAKQPLKTTFEAARVIRPIYTGGPVALTHDVRILATALGDDVVLTDPATGRHLSKVEGDGEAVTSLMVTPPGSHLIMCSRSLGMRIYALTWTEDAAGRPTLETTRTRALKPHGTPVMRLAVDATGTLLATGGTDGVVKVWDIRGGFVTHTFHGPSGLTTSLAFYSTTTAERRNKKRKRDGEESEEEANGEVVYRLIQGTQSGKIKIWDLHRRAAVATLDSHVADVTAVDYSPSQDCIVSASRDKTLTWWDARSWKIRRIVPCLEGLEAAGFCGDNGQATYSAGANGRLRFWSTDTGRELSPEQTPAINEGESIVSAIHHPSMPWIVCAQADYTLALYQPPSDDNSNPHLIRRICGTHDEVIDMQYLLQDRSVLALATNSEEIRLVSVDDSPSSHFGQDLGALKGHSDIIIALAVDWSGHWVATGAKDNTAKVWRVGGPSLESLCWATFSGHAESVGAVAFPRSSPADGSAAQTDPLSHPPPYLLTGSQDYTVKKWDVPREPQHSENTKRPSTRALFTRKAHEKDINAIDIHNGGALFASASQDKTAKIWSLDGEVQGVLRGHRRGVWCVSFAPAHTPAITGEDGLVSAAGSSSRGVILTASGDKTIKLWSLADYSCIRTFEGHANTVLKTIWLPPADKQVLFASAGGDGLVKVWDASSGEAACTLDNHEDRVWALAADPATGILASGSSDSTVTFWRDTSAETREAAAAAIRVQVEQEQMLENYMRADSYREAIVLALQLNHPGRLLAIFTSVVTNASSENSITGSADVDAVIASLSDDQLLTLLLRLRDWNTNARAAPVAQRILSAIVQSYPTARLAGLSKLRSQKSVGDVLHALKVYTERHYKRLDELVDESYLLEYTLREMDALAPEEDVVMDDGLLGC